MSEGRCLEAFARKDHHSHRKRRQFQVSVPTTLPLPNLSVNAPAATESMQDAVELSARVNVTW